MLTRQVNAVLLLLLTSTAPVFAQGLKGDLDCDGLLNTFDIDPFVLALTNPVLYANTYPNCDLSLADCNCDGAINTFDIDPFVANVTSGMPAACAAACCYQDGNCAVVTAEACAGEWNSEWTDCDVAQCRQPTAACCTASGACVITTQNDCDRTWHPEWSDCGATECAAPVARWPGLIRSEPYWTLDPGSAADWNAYNITKSDAPAYFFPPHFTLPTTVNITSSAANGLLWRTLPEPLDLSRGTDGMGYVIEVQCYLDTGLRASINQVELRFFSGHPDTNVSTSAVVSWTGWPSGNVNDLPGWRKMMFTEDSFTAHGSSWTRNMWSHITHVGIFAAATAGGTFNVRVGSIRALYPLEIPVICLGTDDGCYDSLWYSREMTARGIHGTFFCIASELDAGQAGNPGLLSWDDVRSMQAEGHLICNHTATFMNGNGWAAATPAERAADVAQCREAFYAHGLYRGARLLATPGGEFDPQDDAEWEVDGDYKALVLDGVVDHVRLVRQFCRSEVGTLSPYLPYPPALSFVKTLNYFDQQTLLPVIKHNKGLSLHFYHEIDGRYPNPSPRQVIAMLDTLAAERDAGNIYIADYGEILEHVYGVFLPPLVPPGTR